MHIKKSQAFFVFGVVRALTICLFSVLIIVGCSDVPGDLSVSEVTITDIPISFKVDNNSGSPDSVTYKVYLNASNSMNDTDPPAARGVVTLAPEMLQPNHKYTVTIKLSTPIIIGEDPDTETSPWSGTARYFSILISPQELKASDGVDAVWVKGSMIRLDKGNCNISWSEGGLIDFRNRNSIFFSVIDGKAQYLYEGLIENDDGDPAIGPSSGTSITIIP